MPLVFSHSAEQHVDTEDDGRSSGQAARQVAIAITLLMVSFLVLTRSNGALGSGVSSSSRVTAGSIELTDDDDGESLFELPALQPGESNSNCIAVTYRGSVFSAPVGLRFRGAGPLADHLQTTIEMGSGGGFDSCDGFVAAETLYDGDLADLHEQHGPGSAALETFTIARTPESRTFKVTFGLDEKSDAAGLEASTEFLWSVGG